MWLGNKSIFTLQKNQKEIDKFYLNSVSENSLIGYILEVDFQYPGELHELHKDYHLVPKKT